jgi:hypothetical protein
MAEFTPSAEDLLAGSALTHRVALPQHLVQPSGGANAQPAEAAVTLRPLTIGTFQLIMKAAKSDASLIPLLMIKESLVQPALTLDQVRGLQLGLVNFLVTHIREISGLTEKKSPSTS